jgi:hypothetical protein
VANTPNLFRNGAVGFIDWLHAFTSTNVLNQRKRVNRCSPPRLASAPIFGAGTLAQNGYLTPVSRLNPDDVISWQ